MKIFDFIKNNKKEISLGIVVIAGVAGAIALKSKAKEIKESAKVEVKKIKDDMKFVKENCPEQYTEADEQRDLLIIKVKEKLSKVYTTLLPLSCLSISLISLIEILKTKVTLVVEDEFSKLDLFKIVAPLVQLCAVGGVYIYAVCIS